ncbi:MAG: hypothetical protein AB7K52_12905 [Phycisphaerales bacterium]
MALSLVISTLHAAAAAATPATGAARPTATVLWSFYVLAAVVIIVMVMGLLVLGTIRRGWLRSLSAGTGSNRSKRRLADPWRESARRLERAETEGPAPRLPKDEPEEPFQ